MCGGVGGYGGAHGVRVKPWFGFGKVGFWAGRADLDVLSPRFGSLGMGGSNTPGLLCCARGFMLLPASWAGGWRLRGEMLSFDVVVVVSISFL